MNISIIRYTLGQVLKVEAILLLLPTLVGLIYKEQTGWIFLICVGITALAGILFTLKKPHNTVFYLKEGCAITALSWIFLSIFGCLPFCISGQIPSFTNALFETISGFTTTGSSILTEIEGLDHCILFWRSFTHWVGGMGVLVFLLAIVPLSGGSNFNLMKAESPGPSVGKLMPKVKTTAQLLYVIYFGLTMIEIVLLLAGGMPIFDSLTLSFGTAGTGGFGILNDSIASYSAYSQWVIAIFMIMFGINFNIYYYILFREFRKAFEMEEVRCYLIIILCASSLIFITNVGMLINTMSISEQIRHTIFTVASIMTTTGFATVDFDLWPTFSKGILVLLMFIGGCAGSTGGGLKVSRFIIWIKSLRNELHSYLHPRSVRKITLDKKSVDEDVIRATNAYLVIFFIIFVVSTLIISIDNDDLITCFTAVAATINNIGPGLSMVGPTQNFAHFSVLSKYIIMFDMLAGRLELFPLLILFHPSLWRDVITVRRHDILAKRKNK